MKVTSSGLTTVATDTNADMIWAGYAGPPSYAILTHSSGYITPNAFQITQPSSAPTHCVLRVTVDNLQPTTNPLGDVRLINDVAGINIPIYRYLNQSNSGQTIVQLNPSDVWYLVFDNDNTVTSATVQNMRVTFEVSFVQL